MGYETHTESELVSFTVYTSCLGHSNHGSIGMQSISRDLTCDHYRNKTGRAENEKYFRKWRQRHMKYNYKLSQCSWNVIGLTFVSKLAASMY